MDLMVVLALLEDVEWEGDFVTGVVIVAFGFALAAYGFRWGRWRALTVLAAVWSFPLVASDVLYFGFGVDLLGIYCGEPVCDPGPLPATLVMFYLPVALALTGAGVALRRRATTRNGPASTAAPDRLKR
jgi:hypothetical protein